VACYIPIKAFWLIGDKENMGVLMLYPVRLEVMTQSGAEELCRAFCGRSNEDASKCFHCECPLGLAEREDPRVLEALLQMQADLESQLQQIAVNRINRLAAIRCNDLRAAAVIAACT
jgi:hypothetical protein